MRALTKAAALAAIAAVMASAAHAKTYDRAPLADYLIADRAHEIALARTAAPPSVSAAAEVVVLTPHGYEVGAAGTNGFLCMVQRGWFSGIRDPEFWNPNIKAPVCFNRQAVASVWPVFLQRTRWVMAGATQQEIAARTIAAMKAGTLWKPRQGAMTFMLSKEGRLNDDADGPWRPHIMFYMPAMPLADWGANMAGTQINGGEAGPDPWTMIYIPVAAWSDGTAAKR